MSFLNIFKYIIPKPITFSLEGEWWNEDGYGPVGPGSKLGRLYDTWIGRDGFFSFLGGSKARKQRNVISSISREIANIEKRKGDIFPNAMGNFNRRTMSDWNVLQGKNSGSPLTLATDTGKNFNFQNQISTAVNNTNASLTDTIGKAQDRLWAQEDQIANLKAEQKSIRNS